MAGEVQAEGDRSGGGGAYFMVVREADGQIYDRANTVFDDYTTANVGGYGYDLPMIGSASGLYLGDFPALPAGTYYCRCFYGDHTAPTEADERIGFCKVDWDGVGRRIDPQSYGKVDDGSAAAGGFVGNSGLSSSDDFYLDQVLAFINGALAGSARRVAGYTGSTRTFAFAEAFPQAPADGDRFTVLGFID